MKKKKYLSVLLTIAMVLSLCPAALAAEALDPYPWVTAAFGSSSDAVSVSTDEDGRITLTVNQSVTLSATLNVPVGTDVTINLGNYTLTAQDGASAVLMDSISDIPDPASLDDDSVPPYAITLTITGTGGGLKGGDSSADGGSAVELATDSTGSLTVTGTVTLQGGAGSGENNWGGDAIGNPYSSNNTVNVTLGDGTGKITLQVGEGTNGAYGGCGVSTGGDVTVADAESREGGVEITGDFGISCGGNVKLGNYAAITGSIGCGGSVTVGDYATITGGIGCDGSVTVGDHATITGSGDGGYGIGCDGSVTVGANCEIKGGVGSDGGVGIFATGDVTLGAGCKIFGGEGAGTGGNGICTEPQISYNSDDPAPSLCNVTVGANCEITGGKGDYGGDGIFASGDVTVGDYATITGGNGGNGGDGIFSTSSSTVTVGANCKITGGEGTDDSGDNGYGNGGSGIKASSGNVTVGANCEITGGAGTANSGNDDDNGYGGSGISAGYGNVTVEANCKITGGYGSNSGGNGVYAYGNVTVGAGCEITGGAGTNGNGGSGIYAANTATVTVTIGSGVTVIGGTGNPAGPGIAGWKNGQAVPIPITDSGTGAVLTPTGFILELRSGSIPLPSNGKVTVKKDENPLITITAPETGGTVRFQGSNQLAVTGSGVTVGVTGKDPVAVPANGGLVDLTTGAMTEIPLFTGSTGGSSTTTTNPDGSKTTVTKNPDGSTTTSTTGTDGTKTETVEKPNGDKTETVTRPDGSKTATETTTSKTPEGATVSTETRVETGKDGKPAAASATVVTDSKTGELTVPSAVLDKVANVPGSSLTVGLPGAELVFDSAAIKAIIAAGGAAPALTIAPVAFSDLPEKAQAQLEEAATYGFTVKGANGVDFGTGKVTVTLDYARRARDTDVVVYFVDEAGELTYMPGATFQNGRVRFETSHWSVYAVTEEPAIFEDVPPDAWYAPAVRYAAQSGLFAGTSDTTFSPNAPMTRAMLVAVLYRAAGEPDIENESWGYLYSDVPADAYYGTAVYWARLNGVASGYGDGRFGPNDSVTREQLALMLYRYAGSPAAPDLPPDFADAGELSDYARDAMSWAVDQGIVSGKPGNLLDPKGQATRAQVASMLLRYLQG